MNRPQPWQFGLSTLLAAVLGLAAFLAFGRASGFFSFLGDAYGLLRPVHGLCVAGLSLYVSGHVAFWRGRLAVAVLLMLAGVGAFIAAAICWNPFFVS
jgi:hypothetical protein